MITLKLLQENQDKLREKFDNSEVIAYPNVSCSQLSVARYYGGCSLNGKRYTYFPQDDILVRDDVIRFLKPTKKSKKKPTEEQMALA